MDKDLELSLIESGYDSTNSRELTLNDVGKILEKDIFCAQTPNSTGMILFDGLTRVIVRTGLGHFMMCKPTLSLEGPGLHINSPTDKLNDQRSSFFINKEGNYLLELPNNNWKESINLDVINKKAMAATKIELNIDLKTRMYYLPSVDILQSDRLFWQNVGNRFGLNLREIEPQYIDKDPVTPWYSANYKGINLTLGTRSSVYAVKSQFPTKKSSCELKQIVNGLDVYPQTVDENWDSEFSTDGQVCETHIHIGLGNQVVAYLVNLLKTN